MNTDWRLWLYLTQYFLEWEIFRPKFLQKTETYFVFNNFHHEYRVIYDIDQKNMVQPNKAQMTIQYLRNMKKNLFNASRFQFQGFE